MAISSWFDSYVLADNAGLDTSALIRDYAKELLGTSDLDSLSPEKLQIVDATLHAVVWGYPIQETYRLRQLDTALQADPNKLFKPSYAANWLNNHSAPAPNATALYVTGWLDLSEGDQVLWVPENPKKNYFAWAILDSYINTVGSIGPRTQTTNALNNGAFYLLAGPSSEYYKSKSWTASNLGPNNNQTMPIVKIDTPYAWMIARFGTDTLSEAGLGATRDFVNGDKDVAGSGFQLGSLNTFNTTGSIPYSKPIPNSKSDQKVQLEYGRTPELARVFFEQLGQSVLDNPIPALRTAVNKVDTNIPNIITWQENINSVQQPNPDNDQYQPPSALSDIQKSTLNDKFEPIGLDLANGFTLPSNWGAEEHAVFQKAYNFSMNLLDTATTDDTSGAKDTNYWKIDNLDIGVYPNKWEQWLVRAGVAVAGGAANIPNDAVYHTTQKDSDSNTLTSTYNYTITLPNLNSGSGAPSYGPADGFWSYTIYQPDPGSAYQPFLIENAISNRFYSPTNATATLRTDGWLSADKPPNWNNSTGKGTALYTGTSSTIGGLKASTTYYVSEFKDTNNSNDSSKLLFKVSDRYNPDLNPHGINGTKGVPIGGAGSPGSSLQLSGVGSSQTFGWINPVSQLGSAQHSSLQTNDNGEIILHLRANGPKSGLSNWLPTPNSGYHKAAHYFEVMARFYQPTTDSPSILTSTKRPISDALYIPPAIERTSLSRIALWEDLDQAGQDLLLARTGSSSVDLFDIKDPFDADAIGALLDLRWADGAMEGTTWTLNYTYERLAYYTNSLYFYTVDTVTGMINGKSPGDFGYTETAMSRRINPNDPIMNYNSGSTVSGSLELSGGSIYMPLVITEPGQILIPNSRQTLGSTHFKLEGDRGFVFEDRKHLGDHDYNDGMFMVTELTPLG